MLRFPIMIENYYFPGQQTKVNEMRVIQKRGNSNFERLSLYDYVLCFHVGKIY